MPHRLPAAPERHAMMALAWNADRGAADLVLGAGGALAQDAGLTTAVILSLFLDRRAEADDELPGEAGDRRGWIGDALAFGTEPEPDRIGSRLWLLARGKQLPETARLAEDYAREALAWLVTDGLAEEVAVSAEFASRGVLGLAVQVTPPAGDPVAFQFPLRAG